MDSQKHFSPVVTEEPEVKGFSTNVKVNESGDDNIQDLSSILDPLDEIRILQHLDFIEVCLGWERNNRYSIYNKQGEQILYVYEAAPCVSRQCYGSLRALSLIITDNDDRRLLYLQRPLRCSTRCFYACCCLQELDIYRSRENKVGAVLESWNCCIPEYQLSDSSDSLKFYLTGTCTHFRCCCSINFTVKSTSGYEVASICKKWSGLKEIIGACNEFKITYFDGLTKEDKILILGAAFLLDFNYFERHGKCF
ncbi:phospholipid scramblase 2-like [Physella acuta]|uniref:phospholipid scramblase 2-like n=1 Tax=Physella acuta TaxID=109671 RepID=UPI0027DD62F5|nr:phospholipid scramblase 2-like [Physella acuta]XP_059172474.1 phospholipid scramblase 2-like [Physella acuta]XP_059172475.1 phospholipid scramblase 2-like [Physella acuta]XP_059172476.1 phospholipid scramblase 2-like [Physella acuta]